MFRWISSLKKINFRSLFNSFCRKRTLFAYIGVCLLLLMLIYAAFNPSIISVKNYGKRPDIRFFGVVISQFDNGQLSYKVHAKKAAVFKNSSDVSLEALISEFYFQQEPLVYVDAPYGRIGDQSLHFLDPSIMYDYQQDRILYMRSNTLDWDVSSSYMRAKGDVAVHLDMYHFYGDLMTLGIPMKTMRISGRAKAVMESFLQ